MQSNNNTYCIHTLFILLDNINSLSNYAESSSDIDINAIPSFLSLKRDRSDSFSQPALNTFGIYFINFLDDLIYNPDDSDSDSEDNTNPIFYMPEIIDYDLQSELVAIQLDQERLRQETAFNLRLAQVTATITSIVAIYDNLNLAQGANWAVPRNEVPEPENNNFEIHIDREDGQVEVNLLVEAYYGNSPPPKFLRDYNKLPVGAKQLCHQLWAVTEPEPLDENQDLAHPIPNHLFFCILCQSNCDKAVNSRFECKYCHNSNCINCWNAQAKVELMNPEKHTQIAKVSCPTCRRLKSMKYKKIEPKKKTNTKKKTTLK